MGACIPRIPDLTKSDINSTCYEIKICSGLFVKKGEGDPYSKYELIRYLGGGAFGKVYHVKNRQTKVDRAMKIIHISNDFRKDLKQYIRKIDILKNFDHPHIMKVFEYFYNKKNLVVVSELCTGGELFDKIVKQKYFNEGVAANVMKQLLSAVKFCHEHGLVHRDLKPENILIETREDEVDQFFNIKLIDFGTCEIIEKDKMLKEQIGTSYYIAPEVLKNNYNEKCDLWSCGVIMYILLCGCPPFYGNSEDEIYNKIINGNYKFKHYIWNEISYEAKDLICNLLEVNQEKRLSAKDALEHKWFKIYAETIQNSKEKKINKISDKTIKEILKNISEFRAEQKLQQATLAFLVHNFYSNENYSELKNIFLSFDTNGDGMLTRDEFKAGIKELVHDEEIEFPIDDILNNIDTDNNGFIEFEEFVRACIDKETLLTENNLKIAFDLFDKDHSGGIVPSELKNALGVPGKLTKDNYWKNMIKEIDLNGDGEISYEEFKDMMMKVILKNREEKEHKKSQEENINCISNLEKDNEDQNDKIKLNVEVNKNLTGTKNENENNIQEKNNAVNK